MKNKLFILAFLLLCIVPEVTKAQFIPMSNLAMPDTVQFRMNDHLSMEIVSKDYYDFGSWGSTDSLFAFFLADLSKIEDQLLIMQTANNFNYMVDGAYRKIQVNSEAAVKNEISFDDNGDVIYFQVVVIRLNEVDHIIFKSPSIEDFKGFGSMELDQIIQTSKAEVFPEGKGKRRHVSTVFFVENGKIVKDKTLNYGKPMDTIEFAGIVGLGVVRTTLTPDVELRLMFNLSKKGIDRNQFGVSCEAQASFLEDDESHFDVSGNVFLSLVMARSITWGRSNSGRNMAGMKIGRTIVREDSTYDGDAWKLGFYYEMGSRLILEPAFIYEDGFKKIFPTMRIAIIL